MFLGGGDRRAAISSIGRHISSLRRNIFVWPAHPIAAPPSLQSAGASHCRAANLFDRPAHLLAALQYLRLAGALLSFERFFN
jgi:hypothetical protein